MSVKSRVDSAIDNNQVVIFSKSYCPFCRRAKSLFQTEYPDTPVTVIELDEDPDGDAIQGYLAEKTNQRTVPNIFVKQEHIGGSDDLAARNKIGNIKKLLA